MAGICPCLYKVLIGYLHSSHKLLKIYHLFSEAHALSLFPTSPSIFLSISTSLQSRHRPISFRLKAIDRHCIWSIDLQVRSLVPFRCWVVLGVCLYLDSQLYLVTNDGDRLIDRVGLVTSHCLREDRILSFWWWYVPQPCDQDKS